jgi:hypothetical protein
VPDLLQQRTKCVANITLDAFIFLLLTSNAVIPSTEFSGWQQKMALLFYIQGKKLCQVN